MQLRGPSGGAGNEQPGVCAAAGPALFAAELLHQDAAWEQFDEENALHSLQGKKMDII